MVHQVPGMDRLILCPIQIRLNVCKLNVAGMYCVVMLKSSERTQIERISFLQSFPIALTVLLFVMILQHLGQLYLKINVLC